MNYDRLGVLIEQMFTCLDRGRWLDQTLTEVANYANDGNDPRAAGFLAVLNTAHAIRESRVRRIEVGITCI